jgi:gas vesicle protein
MAETTDKKKSSIGTALKTFGKFIWSKFKLVLIVIAGFFLACIGMKLSVKSAEKKHDKKKDIKETGDEISKGIKTSTDSAEATSQTISDIKEEIQENKEKTEEVHAETVKTQQEMAESLGFKKV